MRLLSLILVSAMCSISLPVEADVFEKLKKQVKDSAEDTKKKTKQTVEEEVGVGSAQSPDQMRADLTQKWQACYDSMLASAEYKSCASICNMARQSIADFDGAAKANQSTWKRCNDSYVKAKASAPALTQNAKEKQHGLPAGAMPTQAASASSTPAPAPSAKPAVAPTPVATSSTPTSSKPAAKPLPTSSLTATAADKAAADKYGQGCAGNHQMSSNYDCKCMREEYLAASLLVREDAIENWETQNEPYRRAQLEKAKEMGKGVEAAQKRYDDMKASAYGTPDAGSVSLRLESRSAKCYSRPAIVKSRKEDCMVRNGQKTVMGTPIDDKYCSCFSDKYASALIDEGKNGSQATSAATLACDTESPVYKLKKQ